MGEMDVKVECDVFGFCFVWRMVGLAFSGTGGFGWRSTIVGYLPGSSRNPSNWNVV
jgi:hypothetical protein